MEKIISKTLAKRFTAIDVVSTQQAQTLVKCFGSPLYVYKQEIISKKIASLL